MGRGLYIEGVDFGSENSNTALYSYFGGNFISNGNTSFYGNVSSVYGTPGTIGDGLTFDYLYQQGPDHYVDVIEANEGTIFFRCQNDSGRAVSYAGPNNNYRAIHSTLIFGALQEIINTRNELMARYMEYLTGQTNLENEAKRLDYNCNIITNQPNPFINKTKIIYVLTDAKRVCQVKQGEQNYPIVQIYDINGSLVRSHLLPIANNQFIWDGKDNYGKEVNSGTYLVQFRISNSSLTKPIIKVK